MEISSLMEVSATYHIVMSSIGLGMVHACFKVISVYGRISHAATRARTSSILSYTGWGDRKKEEVYINLINAMDLGSAMLKAIIFALACFSLYWIVSPMIPEAPFILHAFVACLVAAVFAFNCVANDHLKWFSDIEFEFRIAAVKETRQIAIDLLEQIKRAHAQINEEPTEVVRAVLSGLEDEIKAADEKIKIAESIRRPAKIMHLDREND